MKKYSYIIRVFWSEDDKFYIAEVPELEGCITHAKTAELATKKAQSAIESWILAAKKMHHPVPKPIMAQSASGKFNVRIPKYLHQMLVIKAMQEGTSLNQMVNTLLTQSV